MSLMIHLMVNINKKLVLVKIKVIYIYTLLLTQLTKEPHHRYQIFPLQIRVSLIKEKIFEDWWTLEFLKKNLICRKINRVNLLLAIEIRKKVFWLLKIKMIQFNKNKKIIRQGWSNQNYQICLLIQILINYRLPIKVSYPLVWL